MLVVEYDYYRDIYQGSKIPEQDFPAMQRTAAAYLDMVTSGRADSSLDTDTLDRCRMAICGMAEEQYRFDQVGGVLLSVSNAGYTETYGDNGRTIGEKMKAVASLYLGATGLLYRGVDRACSCAMRN